MTQPGLGDAIQSMVGVPATVRVGTVNNPATGEIDLNGTILNPENVGFIGQAGAGEPVLLLGQPPQMGPDPSSWAALGTPRPASVGSMNPTTRVWSSVGQLLASGAGQLIQFNNVDWTTGGMHDTAVNNTQILAPIDGIYQGICAGAFSVNTSGRRIIQFHHNGTLIAETVDGPSLISSTAVQVVSEWPMRAGDRMTVTMLQTTSPAASLTVGTQHHQTWFSLRWMGPLPPGV